MHNKIGEMVHYYRKKQGLSRMAFAKQAGVGKTVIFDIENGKPTTKLNTLLKILNVLDIQMMFRTPLADVLFKQDQ